MDGVLHGVRCTLPEDWDDCSLYRFVAPEPAGVSLPGPLTVKAGDPDRLHFRTNMTVSRHSVDTRAPLAELLRQAAAGVKASTPTYRVLVEGSCRLAGQDAAYHDITFVEEGTRLQLFQRQLAFSKAPGEVTLFTLTSDRSDLDALFAAFGELRHAP